MIKNKINIGILGCSSIAERSTIPAILESELFNLSAVASRSPEKAQSLAGKYGCNWCSYDEIINDPGIDSIYVSLPSGLHYEWGKQVLLAGKHLLMEKPFVDSFEKAEELIKIAASQKLIAMEGLTYVYHPVTIKVHELIKENVIGAVRLIDASFGFPVLPETDIRNNPSLGGGAILDNLIYPLSFSLHVGGKNYNNISYRIINDDNFSIDSRGFLRVDWENITANINYGFGFYYRNCFTIWGETGTIEVDRAFTRPKDMEGEIILNRQGKPGNRIHVQASNQFLETVKAFYRKITGTDNSGLNEGSDILYRMQIISEMYLSSLISKPAYEK